MKEIIAVERMAGTSTLAAKLELYIKRYQRSHFKPMGVKDRIVPTNESESTGFLSIDLIARL